MEVVSSRTPSTLLRRFQNAASAGKIDINEEGGVTVDPEFDPDLANDLVVSLPAHILASGEGAVINALKASQ